MRIYPPTVKDASQLKLWRVTIPLTVDEEDKEITAASISPRQLMQGRLALSQYSSGDALKDTIHIIVDRPKGITTVLSHTFLPHAALYDSEENGSLNS
ncbi:hypothetical protein BGX27_001588, partial [Mortierella sp. AM989]